MSTRIQHRRDPAATWTTNNPTLAQSEIGIETDTSKYKIGDGLTAWTSLSYAGVQGAQGTTGSTGAQGAAGVPIFVQSTSTITSNYTIQSTDSQMTYGVYEAGNTAGIMYFTLQNTTSIPTGTTFTVFRTVMGSTQSVQIQGTSNVTVQSAGATQSRPIIRAQYSYAICQKVAQDRWYITGDIV
jgi:hypothetical protein